MPSEAILAIAKLLEKTPTELGEDVWNLATVIETQGNKGYGKSDLAAFAQRDDLKIETYMLRELHKDCYDGILFYANGSKKWEAKGWVCRKNPHWKVKWMELYGDTNPERLAEFQRAEQERLAAEEAERQRKLARPTEECAGVKFEDLTTLQVGHRYAVAHIMIAQASRRWRQRRWDVPLPPEDEPAKKRGTTETDRYDSMDWYMVSVWDEQAHVLIKELDYRANVLGDEQAQAIVSAAGVHYFYTYVSIERMTDSEMLPEFTNGYLGQPFDDAQPPINRLRDYDVMRQFVALLDPDGTLGGKFEGDDLDAILGILRAQLKRLKPKQE